MNEPAHNLLESALEDSRDTVQKMIGTARRCLQAKRVDDARRIAEKCRALLDESIKCSKSSRERTYFQVLDDDLETVEKQLRSVRTKGGSKKKIIRSLAVAGVLVFVYGITYLFR